MEVQRVKSVSFADTQGVEKLTEYDKANEAAKKALTCCALISAISVGGLLAAPKKDERTYIGTSWGPVITLGVIVTGGILRVVCQQIAKRDVLPVTAVAKHVVKEPSKRNLEEEEGMQEAGFYAFALMPAVCIGCAVAVQRIPADNESGIHVGPIWGAVALLATLAAAGVLRAAYKQIQYTSKL